MPHGTAARAGNARRLAVILAACGRLWTACGTDVDEPAETSQGNPVATTRDASNGMSGPGNEMTPAGAEAGIAPTIGGAQLDASMPGAGGTMRGIDASQASGERPDAGAGAMTGGIKPDAGSGLLADAGSDAGGSTTVNGPDNPGACAASKRNKDASGSGPHKVVIETNADPGINECTIYRPAVLQGTARLPIFIWGEGGCARQGLSNQIANAEIASHGYFVIADGTPSGGGSNRSLGGADAGKPMIAYLNWAIAENNKPCSAYYHKLDPTKVATNGFSCGGLMAEGTASDPRVTTWMINSSGAFAADQALYKATHGPVLIVLGGPSDIAYENGKRDYENLAKLSWPLMLFSKDIGHGGDLFKPGGGDFTKLNLAWINWWLKGDLGPTGKGFLVGDGCSLCKDRAWEVASKNIP